MAEHLETPKRCRVIFKWNYYGPSCKGRPKRIAEEEDTTTQIIHNIVASGRERRLPNAETRARKGKELEEIRARKEKKNAELRARRKASKEAANSLACVVPESFTVPSNRTPGDSTRPSMPGAAMGSIEAMRERWTYLYTQHLPSLAKSQDPVQERWPVHLDHCFARIVLDNAVGVDTPWTDAVKQPATKNMTVAQLEAAIQLAERIATGEADLSALNERSLGLRGKKRKAGVTLDESGTRKKQKQDASTISSYFTPPMASPRTSGPAQKQLETDDKHDEGTALAPKPLDMATELRRIDESTMTPFRKQTLTLLCQIPPGRYSTYQAMSDYITKTSHKTCARAIGSAMRNNPFAPEVPCHRILAADGTLGGFGGHWGENGKFANKKHELLHGEGVRFDSKGKVKGPPFREFHL